MGFKDYCKNVESTKFENKDYTEQTKKVENLYEQYKDKNEDELLSELINSVNKQKQDGTFNYNSIRETIEKISPFLTPEQNIKIKELLHKIK